MIKLNALYEWHDGDFRLQFVGDTDEMMDFMQVQRNTVYYLASPSYIKKKPPRAKFIEKFEFEGAI